MPHIRGWVSSGRRMGRGVRRVEGEGGWANDASRHRQPSYVHSGPGRWPQQPWLYHEPCRRTMGQNWTPSYPINVPRGPQRIYYGPS